MMQFRNGYLIMVVLRREIKFPIKIFRTILIKNMEVENLISFGIFILKLKKWVLIPLGPVLEH